MPLRIRSSVLLPAPLSPTSPSDSPRMSRKLTSASARSVRVGPPIQRARRRRLNRLPGAALSTRNSLFRSVTSMIGSPCGLTMGSGSDVLGQIGCEVAEVEDAEAEQDKRQGGRVSQASEGRELVLQQDLPRLGHDLSDRVEHVDRPIARREKMLGEIEDGGEEEPDPEHDVP